MLEQMVNSALFSSVYGAIILFIQGMLSVCYKLIGLITSNFDELIRNNAVQSYFTFLEVFASILFVAGIAFAIAEWAISTNESGSGNVYSTFKYILLGLFATLGFTTIPILLMQFTAWCTEMLVLSGFATGLEGEFHENLSNNMLDGNTDIGGAMLWSVFAIVFIFTLIKIFLSNMKRGGVLLVQLIACPFHIFNIPRGHVDAFFSWCKQVLALYITTFAQNFLLALGLMILGSSSGVTTANMCLCIGVLLASAEAPQILQQFGLDSSIKTSPTQAIYAASGVANIVGTVSKMV